MMDVPLSGWLLFAHDGRHFADVEVVSRLVDPMLSFHGGARAVEEGAAGSHLGHIRATCRCEAAAIDNNERQPCDPRFRRCRRYAQRSARTGGNPGYL
jgi:hypothetical protein